MTSCIGITVYWSETIFTNFLKENIVFVILFETTFGGGILASFSELQCQSTDTFGSMWVLNFKIYIQGSLLYKECIDTFLKSRRTGVFGD